MKSVKMKGAKLLALCATLILCFGLLVGCSGGGGNEDVSTPDGTLQATFNAMKNGDIDKMSMISGREYNEDSLNGMDKGQISQMMKVFFGKIDVKATVEEQVDENTVKVKVTGKTGDLSNFMTDEMSEELTKKAMEWALKNADKIGSMDKGQQQTEVMKILVDVLNNNKGKLKTVDVDETIKMVKEDGKWIVDPSSSDAINRAVYGNESASLDDLMNNILS